MTWDKPMPRDRAYPKGAILSDTPATPKPEAFIVARWLVKSLVAKEFDIPALLDALAAHDKASEEPLTE